MVWKMLEGKPQAGKGTSWEVCRLSALSGQRTIWSMLHTFVKVSWPSRSALQGPGALPSCWTHWPRTEAIREAAARPANKKHARKNTAKPRANQMMVLLLVSPPNQHQTHPRRSSYKNIIHKIRRQGGGGGTEGVFDNISQSNRRTPTPLPSPTRNWAMSLFVGLVNWLACLFVLIIIPCGFPLVHL